jgi:hypothetical protein
MKRRFFAFTALGLALSGCSNQYFERKDTVTFSAGDAVAWNNAQQIPDPAPRVAYNTNIPTTGERAVNAVRNNNEGRHNWFRSTDETLRETVVTGAQPPQPQSGGTGAPNGGAH